MDRQKVLKWLNGLWLMFVLALTFVPIYLALLMLHYAHKHSPPETLYCQPIFLPDDDRHFEVCSPAHPRGAGSFIVREVKE
jgi:hypothetical protein